MTPTTYENATLDVRNDITTAHQQLWGRIASPGTWWTGAERVAIAAETRNATTCELCHDRKAALSPFSVDGTHNTDDQLPEAVVDVVHRVRTDPGRLTKEWFDSIMASGVTPGQYAEAVGIVITVVSIDTFARGVGSEPWPLPQPHPGDPSGVLPGSAEDSGAWLPTIPDEAGQAPDLNIYRSDGFVPNVQRALSIVPDVVRDISALTAVQYMPYEHVAGPATGDRALTRPQMEVIASRVSVINECFY